MLNVNSAPYHISVDIAGGSTLTLRVTNGGNGYGSDWADWCNAILTISPSMSVSDMAWLMATAGSGISPQRDTDISGGTLQLRGITYAKGIGTHSYNDATPADIEVSIAGLGYNVFDAYVGVDDSLGDNGPSQSTGSCVFQVLVDGVEKVNTPVLNVNNAPYHISVDIAGGSTLTLRVTNGGNGYGSDWADWCNPILKISRPQGNSNQAGLYGEYFDNINLSNLKFTRLDDKVDFEWGTGSPDPRIQPDTFSVRWTGQIVPLYTEEYTFYMRSDDGVRLWIDNQLVIDSWVTQAYERSGNISLVAGREYNIRIEYYENEVSATAVLSWSSASQPKQVVPQDRLFYNHAVPYSHLIIDGLAVHPTTYNNVKLTADIINNGTAATDPNIPVEVTFAIAKYPNGTQDTFSFGQRSYTGVINPGQFITIDSYDSAIPAGTYKIGAYFSSDPMNGYRIDNVTFPISGGTPTPTPTPPPQGAANTYPLTWPTSSKQITLRFGEIDNLYHEEHIGTDIQGTAGSNIVSAVNGQVVYAGNNGDYGNVVFINANYNGKNIQTRYAHLQNYSVTTGSSVTAGQVIGRMGSTGKATGTHLHIEVLESTDGNACRTDGANTVRKDPLTYFFNVSNSSNSFMSSQFSIGQVPGENFGLTSTYAIESVTDSVYGAVYGDETDTMNTMNVIDDFRYMVNWDLEPGQAYLRKLVEKYAWERAGVKKSELESKGILTYNASTGTATVNLNNRTKDYKAGVSGTIGKNGRLIVNILDFYNYFYLVNNTTTESKWSQWAIRNPEAAIAIYEVIFNEPLFTWGELQNFGLDPYEVAQTVNRYRILQNQVKIADMVSSDPNYDPTDPYRVWYASTGEKIITLGYGQFLDLKLRTNAFVNDPIGYTKHMIEELSEFNSDFPGRLTGEMTGLVLDYAWADDVGKAKIAGEVSGFIVYNLALFELMTKACEATGAANEAATVMEVEGSEASLSNIIRDISGLQNTGNFRAGALEHIFEGELNVSGKAVGFHYEGFPTTKGSIIPGTKTPPNSFGVYEAEVAVSGVPKVSNSGKSSFFPQNLSPQTVVDSINEAFANKRLIRGNTYIGTSSNGMPIMMYIDSTGKIISAFPVY